MSDPEETDSAAQARLAASLIDAEQELAAKPELEREIERLSAHAQTLATELAATRAELSAVTDSSSWRLTAPLRHVRLALSRLRR